MKTLISIVEYGDHDCYIKHHLHGYYNPPILYYIVNPYVLALIVVLFVVMVTCVRAYEKLGAPSAGFNHVLNNLLFCGHERAKVGTNILTWPLIVHRNGNIMGATFPTLRCVWAGRGHSYQVDA